MIEIDESDFRRLDLNLLLVFTALLRERSVTRAAQRLYLGQPAVSAALGRLRAFTGDELFVRTPAGMAPTVRALEPAAALKGPLESLEQALFAPPAFDPATSERCFTLGVFDIGEVTLGPVLLARMAAAGPGLRLALKPADRHNAGQLLDDAMVDVAIADLDQVPAWQRRQHLYQEHFLCLFDARRVPVAAPVSLDDYLAYPHLLTSFNGGFSGFVDEVLAETGLARRVVLTTTRFSTLPFMLAEAAAFATLPAVAARAFARQFGLALSPLPVASPVADLALLWHARADHDQGHAWFRALVAQAATGLAQADA